MRNIAENIWETLNDLEEFIEYGYKTDFREKYVYKGCTPDNEQAENTDTLNSIAEEIRKCRKCELCEKRNMVVPGAGSGCPKVLIIGEAPGGDEDRQGIPFIGAAGRYLDKWLDAVNLDRNKDCFIGNIVKCRPPGNRDPETDEIYSCMPYLERQIAILKPEIILTLGRISGRIITGEDSGIGRMRGRIYSYKGIPVVPTYHPSAVLRYPEKYRKPVWEDLQKLRAELDRLLSPRN